MLIVGEKALIHLLFESILGVTGLRDSDILVAVNGKFMDKPEKSLLLFQQLKKQDGKVLIEVVRGEQKRKFTCYSY